MKKKNLIKQIEDLRTKLSNTQGDKQTETNS